MIGTLRRHSTWVWFIIIAFMIVGLVVVFRPQSNYSRGGGAVNYGSIDGRAISQTEIDEARAEVYLRYFFSYGDWPNKARRNPAFDEEQQIYQWLFLVRKLEQYNIRVDTATVARAANSVLRQMGQQGQPMPFEVFVQRVLQPEKLNAGDFERYLRDFLGIQQLASVVGLSGQLITPQDAHGFYVRNFQELSVQAVFFSSSNYLADVKAPSPEAVAQFYTNHMSDYRIPEKVQVRYVRFGISNRLAQAETQLTNLNEIVEANMEQVGTNYTRIAPTLAEAKAKIREEIIRRQALIDAHRQANTFDSTLYDMTPVQATNLLPLARTNGLTVQVTKPFAEDTGPTEFDGGANFGPTAFALTTNNPFAEPIVASDAVYVIALDKRIPSEIPPLDKIRDEVQSDYRHYEAVSLARHAGETFALVATNGLAKGKTFQAVCAEAKVKPASVPPFSRNTRTLSVVEDHLSLNQFKRLAFTTPPGKVSEFSPTMEGGAVVYVQKVLPVDEAKMKADMPQFLGVLRQERQSEAFDEWMRREFSTALANTPLSRRRSGPSGAAPGQP